MEDLDLFLNLESRHGSAWALYHLALVTQLQEQTQRAEGLFRKSLIEFHKEKDLWGETCNLVELANIAQLKGQLEHAARLLGVVDALLATLSERPLSANSQAKYDSTLVSLRTQLGEAVFTTVRTAGRDLPIKKMVAYVLESVRCQTNISAGTKTFPALRCLDTAHILAQFIFQFACAYSRFSHRILLYMITL